MSPGWRENNVRTVSNEQMVYDYFKFIDRKDLGSLLRLFAEDAIVYEPFSNEEEGLKGKDVIQDFLLITILADAGTYRTIEFSNGYHDGGKTEGKETDEISAVVMFGSNSAMKGKFNFKFIIETEVLENRRGLSMTIPSKRIKELHIQIMR